MGEYEYAALGIDNTHMRSLPDVARALTRRNEEGGWRPICLLRHFEGGKLDQSVYVFLCERRKSEGDS